MNRYNGTCGYVSLSSSVLGLPCEHALVRSVKVLWSVDQNHCRALAISIRLDACRLRSSCCEIRAGMIRGEYPRSTLTI